MNLAELYAKISANFWKAEQIAGWAQHTFHRKSIHRQTRSSAGGSLPIITDSDGYIDPSFSEDGSITNAKLANMAQNTIKGRITASSGAPEDLTATQVRTIINVEDGANNYTHPNHTGDVTSVGDGATTIANDAVTNAKAANMAEATIKGRASGAGTGDPTDLTAVQVAAIVQSSVDHGSLAGLADDDHTQYHNDARGDARYVRDTGDTMTGALGIGKAAASVLHAYENSAATGATAGVTIEQEGAGDALLQLLLTGVQRWVIGIDNSDSDKLKIAPSSDVGSGTVLSITTGGVVTIHSGANVTSGLTLERSAAGALLDFTGGYSLTEGATTFNTGFSRGGTADGIRLTIVRGAASEALMGSGVNGDSFRRFLMAADGGLSWGPGSATRDTNLYRSAADTLKTDDSLVVAGALTVSGAVSVGDDLTVTGVLETGGGTENVLIYQDSTTGALPPLRLRQNDVSEEFIDFTTTTVGAGNSVDTAAVGTYYGKLRVAVNGTFKYIPLYNS